MWNSLLIQAGTKAWRGAMRCQDSSTGHAQSSSQSSMFCDWCWVKGEWFTGSLPAGFMGQSSLHLRLSDTGAGGWGDGNLFACTEPSLMTTS